MSRGQASTPISFGLLKPNQPPKLPPTLILIIDYQLSKGHIDCMSYVTRQRRVLLEVFEGAERPLTPSEICDTARKEIPSVGIATVYRAIRQFVAEGRVRVVELPGAAPHYE